jgi:hypothetical protein
MGPCAECGRMFEEIHMCSICDREACWECAEKLWGYDEKFCTNHTSGELCQHCVTYPEEFRAAWAGPFTVVCDDCGLMALGDKPHIYVLCRSCWSKQEKKAAGE